MNKITLEQRLAIAKAYLDEAITLRTIGDLSGTHPSEIAKIAREVLGDHYFTTRYKKKLEGNVTQGLFCD